VNVAAMPEFRLTTTSQIVPGSSVSLATPSLTTVSAMISAEGDVYLNSFGGTQGWIELKLFVDNTPVRTLRASAVNYSFPNVASAWHISTIMTLTPGDHVFRLEARTISAAGGAMVVNSQPGSFSVLYLGQ